MFAINAKLYVSNLLLYNHIDKFVRVGMIKGAKVVADKFVDEARKNLSNSITSSGGHETGRLSGSIFSKSGDSGLTGHARWDIIVDTARAPYALWVEYGRSAGEGLPYSKTGGRDYSKSKFKGHKYLSKTLTRFRQDSYATQLVANEIVKALLSAKSIDILKRIV